MGLWKLLNWIEEVVNSSGKCENFHTQLFFLKERGWRRERENGLFQHYSLPSTSKQVVLLWSLPPPKPWHTQEQRNSLINVNWNRAISWKPFAELSDCPGPEVFLYSFIMIYGFGQHTHRREIVDMWNPTTENLSISTLPPPPSVHQISFCLFKDYRGFGC